MQWEAAVASFADPILSRLLCNCTLLRPIKFCILCCIITFEQGIACSRSLQQYC